MSDTTGKIPSEPISKEQLLLKLGHRAQWARKSRYYAWADLMHFGSQDDLDIAGIRGIPGPHGMHGGYLSFLEDMLLHPERSNMEIVSDEENELIRKLVIEETTPEIEKYRARLTDLEKSASAVTAYIFEMNKAVDLLNFYEKTGQYDASSEGIAKKEADRAKIVVINQEIQRYTALLTTLEPSS